jgi:membrane fusion protein (multidrug efflux system)
MIKKIAIGLGVALLVFAGVAGVKVLQIRALVAAGAAMVMPPETVSSAEVVSAEWAQGIRSVGSVTPVQGVTLSAELPGTVEKVAFESGAEVAAGDLLVQLGVATEEAQLRVAEAEAELMKAEMERASSLRETRAIAASEFDSTASKHKVALAAVDNFRSVIAKKTIRAPFAGRTGIRQVNVGQFITAGAPIVSLQATERVYVDFKLPQQRLAEIAAGMEVRVESDAHPGRPFAGKITAVDAAVDPVARSLWVQATFDNPDGALRPGMFVRVEVVVPRREAVLVVPATAVMSAPYGDSVYVIESGSGGEVARQQFIRVGEARGDFVAVRSGLAAGQRVVSAGAFKLRNGAPVKVENRLAPKPEERPTPGEG